MPGSWRTLLPLALTAVLVAFIVGAVVAGSSDEPQRRVPVEMTPGSAETTAPGSTPSQRPTSRPSKRQRPSNDVTVITPRPSVRDDDSDDRDDDDGRHERDDDDGPDDD